MNCEKCQNELFELFGDNTLPIEIENHLKSCSVCSELLDELRTVQSGMGSDQTFIEGTLDVDKAVEEVNQKIDRLEVTKVTSVARWKSFVPMAAALLIVIGVGFLSQIIDRIDSNVADGNNDSIETSLLLLSKIDTETLNKSDFTDFVDEYSYEYGFDEELDAMDDLTEEQFEYLQEHLDVEEIL